jgi:hypothetical protein
MFYARIFSQFARRVRSLETRPTLRISDVAKRSAISPQDAVVISGKTQENRFMTSLSCLPAKAARQPGAGP